MVLLQLALESPPHIKPRDISDINYFGICGYSDFNHKEMLSLEKKLAKLETPHRFIYYANKHLWPPQEMCTRALEWMEFMAIKEGIIPKKGGESFIRGLYEMEYKLASRREEDGEIFYACIDYLAIARTFSGFRDVKT